MLLGRLIHRAGQIPHALDFLVRLGQADTSDKFLRRSDRRPELGPHLSADAWPSVPSSMPMPSFGPEDLLIERYVLLARGVEAICTDEGPGSAGCPFFPNIRHGLVLIDHRFEMGA